VACHVLEAGGEQVSFDATSDAQIQLRDCSEQHKKRESSQASFGQDVGSGWKWKKETVQNSGSKARMSMKTKGRISMTPSEAGMSMKTQVLSR
jgi:hypothetical protein